MVICFLAEPCGAVELFVISVLGLAVVGGYTVASTFYNDFVLRCTVTADPPSYSPGIYLAARFSGNAACASYWQQMRAFVQLYVGGSNSHPTPTFYWGLELSCNNCNSNFVGDGAPYFEYGCWQDATLLYGNDQNNAETSVPPVYSSVRCF